MTKPRLSNKRFGIAVKALNEIAANGKTDEKRLRAVELLLDLYARFDANAERKEQAKAKAKERDKAEDHREQGEAAETQEPPSETDVTTKDQQVQAVFDRLMNKGKTDAIAE
jgi:hypothetical protein